MGGDVYTDRKETKLSPEMVYPSHVTSRSRYAHRFRTMGCWLAGYGIEDLARKANVGTSHKKAGR